jgi:O-acetyl-ADP-ribose deacetylase (regulator of RNase III)
MQKRFEIYNLSKRCKRDVKSITYLKGDATSPDVEGNKIICHICNDVSGWGRGFVLSLSKKWKEPEAEYRKWANGTILYRPFKLGQVQFVRVEKDIVVANMIGQHDIRFHNGIPPIRYDAVDECLKKVAEVALKYKASVCCPKIGAGLAGGDWNKIEALIIENLCKKDIDVYIYELE